MLSDENSLEQSQAPSLEIAHVLFMDIVGYTKFPIDRQRRLIKHLQGVVSGSPTFIRAKTQNQLISLHAGDGMALVFFNDAEAATQCAVEVSRVLRANPDEIPLRMGLHTGPVYRMADINANNAVAGGGINVAPVVRNHVLCLVKTPRGANVFRINRFTTSGVPRQNFVHSYNAMTCRRPDAASFDKILAMILVIIRHL